MPTDRAYYEKQGQRALEEGKWFHCSEPEITQVVMQLLHDEIARTMGNVYSLGILDMPEKDWTPFLGDKAHLPYRSLDPIRTCAKRVASLSCSDGTETLWKLPSDCR